MSHSQEELLKNLIYVFRGHPVMLDKDLAPLYGVETKVLNQAVKRNLERFPSDFMFQLTQDEELSLRSQIVTSNMGRGGKRYRSNAFTELGIAMLSSVLKSGQAIQTNIRIMRLFFDLRKLVRANPHVKQKIEKLEKESNYLFKVVFQRLDQLEIKIPLLPPGRRKIGF
ncbi:MAG: hypothetical protein A2583_12670 [Bdellovibrionales bacterium RIFOXYD1_FULL_53_11]|nr:MAG: hypothetical protein A2583_12670 [Bdellovibrionales bacterium RIFOXYD1_FULL_53_11]